MTQDLITCLWFDNKAEEAANFYVSVFKNSILKPNQVLTGLKKDFFKT